jgi:LPXTG-motif cell wall-anchored protein
MDAVVESGTATFTVGPDGCAPEVGPISFSTYSLPSGQILPYEEQVLIAHAAGNGSFYGAGSYTLTASLGDALNWQADLYFGESVDQPPHPNMIAVDAQTGVVAAAPTTTPTTTTPATTAPTTTAPTTTVAVASLSPSVNPSVSIAPTVNVDNETNVVVTPQVVSGGATAPAAQTPTTTTTTTTTPSGTLPQTGGSPATPLMLVAGGALTAAGWVTRRLARRG